MRIFFKGLNTCPQRQHKLAQYRAFLAANGHVLVSEPGEADEILVWTCAFRDDVQDNTLTQLNQYRDRYGKPVTAAGCMPNIAPDVMETAFDGTVIAWTDEVELERRYRTDGPGLAETDAVFSKPAVCEDAAAYRAAHPDADVIFHDQFVQLMISEGCPFLCTYCSERLAFPPYRSFPPDDLVAAVTRRCVEADQFNVMLIADSLGEYGRDIDSGLVDLSNRILAADGRIRLAYANLHPWNVLEDLDGFIDLVRGGRVLHLNLPVQSGSDAVLKRMGRLYDRAGIDRLFSTLRGAGFTDFDTHVIVGFPGETEADFEATMSFLLDQRPRYVLVSCFMAAREAAAARLSDQVPPEVMAWRNDEAARRLRAAGILCTNDGGAQDRLRRLNEAAP